MSTPASAKPGSVSETAHWIAAYRAAESARPDALFKDPFAASLAGTFGKDAPKAVPSWPMVVRTKLIDDLVLASVADGADCVVNLAAGLDTRPYRLALPSTLRWVEADFPAMVDAKERALAAEKPVCALSLERIDLSDVDARGKMLDRALDGAKKALVLTEGLLVYLPEPSVRRLGEELYARSSVGYWMMDIASPAILQRMQKATAARLDEKDRMKFAPDNGVAYFEAFGWRAREIRSLFRAAGRYRRLPFPMSLFSLFPDPDPRNPGRRPWGAVVRYERGEESA